MSLTSNRKIYVSLDLAFDQPLTPVGLLKLERKGVIESGEFAYGKHYLASPDAFALNPNYLPLQGSALTLAEHRLRDGGALPLTFRDALPDSWGRRVLEAQHGQKLSDVDTLLLSNTDRVGAMVFSENLPLPKENSESQLIPLKAMAEAVRKLEFSMEISPEMRRLLHRGGTLGGARPKASFVHDDRRWLAKFPAQGDDHDVSLLEISILALANKCGIDVSPSMLEKIPHGHALLVQRFDRIGPILQERRLHYLSAAALLNTPYESHEGSYLELAQLLRRISANPSHDLEQLFRRMIFNLFIDNTDDHLKNHGALYMGHGQYQLAPAFDLVMQLTNLGYQELAIKPQNHDSKLSLAMEVAPHFGIHEQTATAIIESIKNIVEQEFISILTHYGANQKLLERVKICLKCQYEIISSS